MNTRGNGNGSVASKVFWTRGMAYLRRRDPKLARILGPDAYRKMELDVDYYGAIVESIVFQQLAGRAAESILRKFKGLYNGRLPKPSEFLKTEERMVRGAGISPQKSSYIRDLCQRLDRGLLELEAVAGMADDDVVEELSKVRGIGRWTSEMFLIFSLGRPDVFPVDDLGIRKAVQRLYGLRKLPDRKKMKMLSRKWHPYCTIATLCLWRSVDTVTVGKGKT